MTETIPDDHTNDTPEPVAGQTNKGFRISPTVQALYHRLGAVHNPRGLSESDWAVAYMTNPGTRLAVSLRLTVNSLDFYCIDGRADYPESVAREVVRVAMDWISYTRQCLPGTLLNLLPSNPARSLLPGPEGVREDLDRIREWCDAVEQYNFLEEAARRELPLPAWPMPPSREFFYGQLGMKFGDLFLRLREMEPPIALPDDTEDHRADVLPDTKLERAVVYGEVRESRSTTAHRHDQDERADDQKMMKEPIVLTEKEAVTLAILLECPSSRPLLGRVLVERLADTQINTDESYLRRRIIPRVRELFGVSNAPRVGYFLPDDRRDEARRALGIQA